MEQNTCPDPLVVFTGRRLPAEPLVACPWLPPTAVPLVVTCQLAALNERPKSHANSPCSKTANAALAAALAKRRLLDLMAEAGDAIPASLARDVEEEIRAAEAALMRAGASG